MISHWFGEAQSRTSSKRLFLPAVLRHLSPFPSYVASLIATQFSQMRNEAVCYDETFVKPVVSNLGWITESPRKLFYLSKPRPHSKPSQSEFRGVGLRHRHFLNLPGEFQCAPKLRVTAPKRCCSNFNMHTNHLGELIDSDSNSDSRDEESLYF